MNDDQIKHMVDRFLGWRLPENFYPDCGISFKKTFNDHLPAPTKHEPTGTNLFDCEQAEAMIRYMIEGLPTENTCPQPAPPAAETLTVEEIISLIRIASVESDWHPKVQSLLREWRDDLAARPKIEDAEVAALVKQLRDHMVPAEPFPHGQAPDNDCISAADLLERLASELVTAKGLWEGAMHKWDYALNAGALLKAKLAEREAELAKARRDVEQFEGALETLTTQQSNFLCDRELQESAIDLVALWKAQKISGATRADRNAAIENVRERLISACERHAARQQQKASDQSRQQAAKEG